MTPRTLIFLPGLDGTGIMFRPLLAQLPGEIHAIVIAYPTHTLKSYDDLLADILRQLPDEPFVILSESFSGPLALRVAATRPTNLLGVMLCATFVRNPVRFRPKWLRHFARPIMFAPFARLSHAKLMFGRHTTPELRAASFEAKNAVSPAVIAHRVREALSVDVRRELLDCPVPILYIRAGSDRLI